MKFSVIVPAHNEETNIGKALESIFSQSFKDFECIVVCDSCTDHTKEIAQMFPCKIVEIQGGSSAAARNAGLDVAQGEWVLFCDADDWYLHEYVFEMLADRVGKEGEDVVLFGIIWKYIGYGPVRSPKGTIYPHVANKCWRRERIGTTRFPDIKVAEDEGFFKKMRNKGIRMVEWDMPLYYYNYLAAGSKSVSVGRSVEKTKQYWSNH